jgi:hypothetical protein
MMFRMETAAQFAHKANMARYQKSLATYLTDEERRFIERRMAEEKAALQQLGSTVACEGPSTHAV